MIRCGGTSGALLEETGEVAHPLTETAAIAKMIEK
jgi:hypothetical protein